MEFALVLSSCRLLSVLGLIAALGACASPRPPPLTDPLVGFEGKLAPPVALLFVALDADRDGFSSSSEVIDASPALFAAGDRNADGRISGFEYAAWAEATFGDADAGPARIGFDVDLDGSVTAAEFQARLGDEFAQLDRDRDGRLARAELLVEIKRPRPPSQTALGGPPPGAPRPRPAG
jgi:hypothetical protein